MITLRDACCSYRKNEAALRDISCELHAGIHLLMGANGAGKTTLMHLMAGLRYPSSGECLLDGRSLRVRPNNHTHCLGLRHLRQLEQGRLPA